MRGKADPQDPRPLGQRLVDAGLITVEARDDALRRHHDTGFRLGEILLVRGLIDRGDLYRHLADLWGLGFADLSGVEPDPPLLFGLTQYHLARESWVPIRTRPDGRVEVATSEPPDFLRTAAIERSIGRPVTLVAATDLDVLDVIHRAFRLAVIHKATMGLWDVDATASARHVLSIPQRIMLWTLVALLVAAIVFAPGDTLIALSAIVSGLFLVSVSFKFVVAMVGVRRERWSAVADHQIDTLEDRDLPRYTILVPVFREANIIGQLIGNLGALDYPPELLDVIVLIEESDPETLEALLAANPPSYVRSLLIPAAEPQTKPKACNVGLEYARGEFLVIYDAEDAPDADQLKVAVAAFRNGDPRLVCVQAALNYWNAEENALTRMFTLEYSYWFDYMLPGLDRLGLPIPLGGTSNHFRTNSLHELGGWDPYNVTEDADLGIRVAATGGTVGVIPSTTFEEANRAYGNWIRQRSRWIKGYMQTLLVHLRLPMEMVRSAGWRGATSFMLLIGGTPYTFLATPPLLALFVVTLVSSDSLGQWFPAWVLYVSLFNLLIGNSLMIYLSMMGAFKRRRYRLVLWALLNPLYWILHSIAAYKALWQLIRDPHYWEKTVHGLSDQASPNEPTPGRASGVDDADRQPVAR